MLNGIVGAPILSFALYSDGGNGAYITWEDNGSSETEGLYIQRVGVDGNTMWDAVRIPNISISGIGTIMSLKLDVDNIPFFVWEKKYNEANPYDDIYAQRIDGDGNLLWEAEGKPVSSAEGIQRVPQIIPSGERSFIVAWTDDRNGNLDIYAQKINLDGTLGDIAPTPTNTPTPTPVPCVLEHFGDPILQGDEKWGALPYGGIREKQSDGTYKHIPFRSFSHSIKDWGCNLTSNAMIISYYANLQQVPVSKTDPTIFQTDPEKLNDWLTKKEGYIIGDKVKDDEGNVMYVTNSSVSYGSVSKYAKEHGVSLSYDVVSKPEAMPASEFTAQKSENLNQRMCSLRPAILKVDHPQATWHFPVASGIATVSGTHTWRLHDPLHEETTTLSDAYDNEHHQIVAATTEVPDSFLEVAAHSPVEFILTDPQERKLGYDPLTDTHYDEIPNSSYGVEELSSFSSGETISWLLAYIKNPLQGEYLLKVIGTGDGDYTIETRKIFDTIEKLPFIDGTIINGAVDAYTMEITDDPNDTGNITRQIPVDVQPVDRNERIIHPGGPNVLPVYILSTPTFDVQSLDTDSIRLGPRSAEPMFSRGVARDINRDRLSDLLYYFKVDDLGVDSATSELCLHATTNDGMAVEGCDEVTVISREDYINSLLLRQ